jgi:acetyl-CoA acetyltransferase family protein
MLYKNACIPFGAYWSTPFCKWQGSFAHMHAMKFAAEVAGRALKEKKIEPTVFDNIYVGVTVPQPCCFYGAPWVAGMIGAVGISGPMIGQACATSATSISLAAKDVDGGTSKATIVITCDRTSNGPHLYYPNPFGPGGTGDSEDWVWHNFGHDPFAQISMIQTAENVAKEAGIKREEQEEVTLLRYRQYQDALKDNCAFQQRYMISPLDVKDPSGRKVIATVKTDEGVFPSTAEGLAKLKPVVDGGTVTFGCQTFPADGNCGMIVCTREKAQELSRDRKVEIRLLSYAPARTKKGYMAAAVVPAARLALSRAGIGVKDLKAVKTHNPFAVNDIYLSREIGIPVDQMNNYGSSLIWGHPQAPTGMRATIELIEELMLRGGGYGLFAGCAAGDSAAALVVKVDM